MIIFPAIDIKDGVCVRLKKGDYRQITTYENTPIDQATTYFKNGFNNIHIVDIDGALHGRPVNSILISEIVKKVKSKIQIDVTKSPHILDWGKNININQKGITPKLNHK